MEFPGPKGFARDFPGKFDSSNVSRDNVSRGIGRIVLCSVLCCVFQVFFVLCYFLCYVLCYVQFPIPISSVVVCFKGIVEMQVF